MKIAELLPLKLYPCSSMVNNTFRTQVERTLLDDVRFSLLLLWHKITYRAPGKWDIENNSKIIFLISL